MNNLSEVIERIANDINRHYPIIEERRKHGYSLIVSNQRQNFDSACGAIVMYISKYGIPERYNNDIVEMIKGLFFPSLYYKPRGSNNYIIPPKNETIEDCEWIYFYNIVLFVDVFRYATDMFIKSCESYADKIYEKYKHRRQ
ncbi:MAG: hypothetical protein ACI4TK_19155 [Agathobacter sp.]|uniref:hypothetical protein n=1 Tax=Ruminococcus sp. TaxID=41978 RepID=UPI003EF1ED21